MELRYTVVFASSEALAAPALSLEYQGLVTGALRLKPPSWESDGRGFYPHELGLRLSASSQVQTVEFMAPIHLASSSIEIFVGELPTTDPSAEWDDAQGEAIDGASLREWWRGEVSEATSQPASQPARQTDTQADRHTDS